jgi:putative Ca2+/H+ antiporter (TMEM165/GDT1 family)
VKTSSVSDRSSILVKEQHSPTPPVSEADGDRAVAETPIAHSPTKSSNGDRGAWGVFASTFVTIFLAELGDKTQLATLLMTAESQSPWIVFAGAGSALVATSLLGVILGRWLAKRVSPKTLERSAAIVLLFIAATLVWDVVH